MKSLPDLERIQIKSDLKWAEHKEKLNERLLGKRAQLMQSPQKPQVKGQEEDGR